MGRREWFNCGTPNECPNCHATESFAAVGPGVERLEQEAAELFPDKRILVLSSDLVSPTMAYVKLKCAIPPRFFTDQLSLLKIDGRWQIAQKVFATELRD